MNQFVADKTKEIADLCQRFGVERLELFGSAASDHFDRDRSDVDFLVRFHPKESANWDDYFGLQFAFEELFQRPVDLVEEAAVENPFFWAAIERSRQVIYAA